MLFANHHSSSWCSGRCTVAMPCQDSSVMRVMDVAGIDAGVRHHYLLLAAAAAWCGGTQQWQRADACALCACCSEPSPVVCAFPLASPEVAHAAGLIIPALTVLMCAPVAWCTGSGAVSAACVCVGGGGGCALQRLWFMGSPPSAGVLKRHVQSNLSGDNLHCMRMCCAHNARVVM